MCVEMLKRIMPAAAHPAFFTSDVIVSARRRFAVLDAASITSIDSIQLAESDPVGPSLSSIWMNA